MNKTDIRFKYFILKTVKPENCDDPEAAKYYLNILKNEVRNWKKKQRNEKPLSKIIWSDSDSYIELIETDCETLKQAEDYFDIWFRKECISSQYDCTGQLFTVWHKTFKRRNKWFIYHKVSMDI